MDNKQAKIDFLAKNVMKWEGPEPVDRPEIGADKCWIQSRKPLLYKPYHYYDPFTNIEQAFMLLDVLHKNGYRSRIDIDNEDSQVLVYHYMLPRGQDVNKSLSEAITNAVLQAEGWEE